MVRKAIEILGLFRREKPRTVTESVYVGERRDQRECSVCAGEISFLEMWLLGDKQKLKKRKLKKKKRKVEIQAWETLFRYHFVLTKRNDTTIISNMKDSQSATFSWKFESY